MMSSSPPVSPPSSSLEQAAAFLMCAFGICFCYLGYGVLQEKFFSERIVGATFLLVWSCAANVLTAFVWQQIQQQQQHQTRMLQPNQRQQQLEKEQQTLNHPLLFLASFCYISAMTLSNSSLAYVTYPTAVLAKSCKLIPTMAMGFFIEGKSYQWQEWLAASAITLGIVLFNVSRLLLNKNQDVDDNDDDDDNSLYGLALLIVSLTMDGVLGSCQGLLKRTDTITTTTPNKRRQRPPTAVETMFWMNLYALWFVVPLATVLTDEWKEGMARLSEVRTGLVLITLAAACGQIFIFLTITWYSPLVCTTVTTTRKFFTILLSVLHFGHYFTNLQWLSVFLVFFGLYLGIASKQQQQQQGETVTVNGKSKSKAE